MFVSGFTIVRNAIKYDYPIVEAIRSLLPLVDEMVVAVGNSEDETLNLIKQLNEPKIRIIETIWDDTLREGGKVLAVETNKAFDALNPQSDWCFYIQGDEVLHEQYIPVVREAMLTHQNNPRVEGLLFKYLHFYGSYNYIGDSRRWYRNEIRIVRRNPQIRSYRDAQGFRINNRKLNVKPIDAFIYHYGWVKPPEAQQAKQESFHKMWHSDEWMQKNIPKTAAFDYSQIDSLQHFTGSHPQVMQARIQQKNWTFDFDPTQRKLSLKNQFLRFFEKMTNYRIGEYKNYRIF